MEDASEIIEKVCGKEDVPKEWIMDDEQEIENFVFKFTKKVGHNEDHLKYLKKFLDNDKNTLDSRFFALRVLCTYQRWMSQHNKEKEYIEKYRELFRSVKSFNMIEAAFLANKGITNINEVKKCLELLSELEPTFNKKQCILNVLATTKEYFEKDYEEICESKKEQIDEAIAYKNHYYAMHLTGIKDGGRNSKLESIIAKLFAQEGKFSEARECVISAIASEDPDRFNYWPRITEYIAIKGYIDVLELKKELFEKHAKMDKQQAEIEKVVANIPEIKDAVNRSEENSKRYMQILVIFATLLPFITISLQSTFNSDFPKAAGLLLITGGILILVLMVLITIVLRIFEKDRKMDLISISYAVFCIATCIVLVWAGIALYEHLSV
ncbi:MAG: hypothetical protein FWG96_01020 [Methanomassiliicoccaceae archaeon]|nr:hypothetical protein [Methanomassiliicoccaceae archaeon]